MKFLKKSLFVLAGLVASGTVASVAIGTSTNNSQNLLSTESSNEFQTLTSSNTRLANNEAIANNLQIPTNGTEFSTFGNQLNNVSPWKRMVGLNGISNIENNIGTNSLKYLFTPISNDGNLNTPIIGTLDFSSVSGINVTKCYYSGGIYSEAINAFVGVFSLFDSNTNLWHVYLGLYNEQTSNISLNKLEPVKVAALTTTDTYNMTYSIGSEDSPFEFNIVPYFKTNTYRGSSDEFFMIYKYNTDYRLSKPNSFDSAKSSFMYPGVTASGSNATDVFRTQVRISVQKEIIWDRNTMNQFKNQAVYDEYISYSWNDAIVAIRPVLYSDNTQPLLTMIKSPYSNANPEKSHAGYLSIYNNDLREWRATLLAYSITSDNQYGSEIKWRSNVGDQNLYYRTRYIDIFNTKSGTSSSNYQTGFSVSYLFRESNLGNSCAMFNSVVGLKNSSSALVNDNDVYVADTQRYSFDMQQPGVQDFDIRDIYYDTNNNKVYYLATYMQYLKYDSTTSGYVKIYQKNCLVSINFDFIMDYDLANLENSDNKCASISTLIADNIDNLEYTWATDKLKNDADIAVEPSIIFDRDSGNFYYSLVSLDYQGTKSVKTYFEQSLSTVDTTSFGPLKPTMTINDITKEQIINCVVNAKAFTINNVPLEAYLADNTIIANYITSWKKQIVVEKLDSGYNTGTLSFKLTVPNSFNTNFVENTSSSYIVNQSNNTTDYIFTINGFVAQEGPTAIKNNGILNVANVSNIKAKDYTKAEALNYIKQHSGELFEYLPPNATITINQYNTDASVNAKGEIKLNISIDKYFDRNGKLQTGTQTYDITLTGFKVLNTTQILTRITDSSFNSIYTSQYSESDALNFIKSKIGEIFNELPDQYDIRLQSYDNSSDISNGNITMNIIISPAYVNGEEELQVFPLTIYGFKPISTSEITTTVSSGTLSGVNEILASDWNQNQEKIKQAIIDAGLIKYPANKETINTNDISLSNVTFNNNEGKLFCTITINNSKAWSGGIVLASKPFDNITLSGFGTSHETTIREEYNVTDVSTMPASSYPVNDAIAYIEQHREQIFNYLPTDAKITISSSDYNIDPSLNPQGKIKLKVTVSNYNNAQGIATGNPKQFDLILTGFDVWNTKQILTSIEVPGMQDTPTTAYSQDTAQEFINNHLGEIFEEPVEQSALTITSYTNTNLNSGKITLKFKLDKYYSNGNIKYGLGGTLTLTGFKIVSNPSSLNTDVLSKQLTGVSDFPASNYLQYEYQVKQAIINANSIVNTVSGKTLTPDDIILQNPSFDNATGKLIVTVKIINNLAWTNGIPDSTKLFEGVEYTGFKITQETSVVSPYTVPNKNDVEASTYTRAEAEQFIVRNSYDIFKGTLPETANIYISANNYNLDDNTYNAKGQIKLKVTVTEWNDATGATQPGPKDYDLILTGFKTTNTEQIQDRFDLKKSDIPTKAFTESEALQWIQTNKLSIFNILPDSATITITKYDNLSLINQGIIKLTILVKPIFINGEATGQQTYNLTLTGFKPLATSNDTTLVNSGVLINVSDILASNYLMYEEQIKQAIIDTSGIILYPADGQTLTPSDIVLTNPSFINKNGLLITDITIINQKAWEGGVTKAEIVYKNIQLKGFKIQLPTSYNENITIDRDDLNSLTDSEIESIIRDNITNPAPDMTIQIDHKKDNNGNLIIDVTISPAYDSNGNPTNSIKPQFIISNKNGTPSINVNTKKENEWILYVIIACTSFLGLLFLIILISYVIKTRKDRDDVYQY